MLPSKNSRQSASALENVFYGSTLKEAYREVESRYGRNVIILGTRKITRRQETGLGHEELIEVTVQPPGTAAARVAPSAGLTPAAMRSPVSSVSPAATASGTETRQSVAQNEIVRDITREVERIENLVRNATQSIGDESFGWELEGNPLAETLAASGASHHAVETLLTRFAGETGAATSDRPAALAWLTRNLRASNCGWEGFFGCHAFLGDAGCGRTKFVLGAAAELQKRGRKTLVLSLHPAHAGEIRRLQNAAAKHGFDAAIIRKDDQLARNESHLGKYDAVLLDLPALDHPSLRPGGQVHGWLARNPGFHRHLVLPLDRDLQDLDDLAAASRVWNCDWVAVNRLDRTRLQGKLLDLAERIPLPYSLSGEMRDGRSELAIAASEPLLDRILAAGAERAEGGFVAGGEFGAGTAGF